MLNIFARSIMTAARNPEPQPTAPQAYRAEVLTRADSKADAQQ